MSVGGVNEQSPIAPLGKPSEGASTLGVQPNPIQAGQKAEIGELQTPKGGGAEFQKFAGMEPEHALNTLSTIATAPEGVPAQLAGTIRSAIFKR